MLLNALFYYGRLGYTVEKIPRSRFHLSEEMSRRVALSVASSWNVAVDILKSLSTGHDWTLFLKVFSTLCMFTCYLSQLADGLCGAS